MRLDKFSGTALVLGSQGLLGRAWCRLLLNKKIQHRPLDRAVLDITDERSLAQQITSKTPLVINTAAFTDVDAAEQNPNLAQQVNATAVGYVAQRCQAVGATLIHYSTDYVFNGRSSQPYNVAVAHDPINVYGRSKAAGEILLQASGCAHLLIRTSWLYAPWGKNFVRTILARLGQDGTVRVVTDQRGRPTSATHLARSSWELYTRGERGTFHICDEGECTWYEFAQEIARISNTSGQIQACTTADFPQAAQRPPYSVLDLTQTSTLLGTLPLWQENLAEVLRELPS